MLEGLLGAGLVERLADEARQVDLGVRGDDHGVRSQNILGGEQVLGADGALRLDLDPVAHVLGGLAQALRGHERVRDPGRARGDRDDALAAVAGGGHRGRLGLQLGLW